MPLSRELFFLRTAIWLRGLSFCTLKLFGSHWKFERDKIWHGGSIHIKVPVLKIRNMSTVGHMQGVQKKFTPLLAIYPLRGPARVINCQAVHPTTKPLLSPIPEICDMRQKNVRCQNHGNIHFLREVSFP
jgi:hypothetical protein